MYGMLPNMYLHNQEQVLESGVCVPLVPQHANRVRLVRRGPQTIRAQLDSKAELPPGGRLVLTQMPECR